MPYTNNFQRFNNRWYWVSIRRYPGAEPEGSSNEHTIYVYNTDTYVKEDCILKEFKTSLRGKDVFYHGTTAESAKSIIEQGIDLTESTRHVDFSAGKGFYVTDDYEKACQWSKRKQRFHCRKPAVVVFKIDSNLRQNETHLLLKVDNDTNRKFWECIVSHFRHGKRSPVITRILEDVKYIEGPVAHNRRLGQQEIPTPKDSGKFQQLCVCNQGYARKFGSLENILCVIFIVD
ncbi:unnamed protein product [Candidula unifasciata]|uniref:PARP n=1 Tax=Candidula unifasciata TaxID=100452 RepID=A0A8S3ZQJ3_9EUPU|nr:unnamed protein product [Candidula unifasciata]